ncbi:MAG: LpxD N-terminal domain-containing protein, partial [Nautiliaceae bacterium]
RLSEICDILDIKCDRDIEITGINTLADAKENELSFFHNEKYKKYLSKTKASAVLIEKKFKDLLPKDTIALITDEPYLKLALLSKYFVISFFFAITLLLITYLPSLF